MKKFFAVITAGKFWLHVVFVGVAACLLVFISLFLLKSYTLHGESVTVPDLKNYTIEQVSRLLESTELQFEITDSIYNDELPRGVVVTQNPDPDLQVKQGRTIFITVNSKLPELVEVPDLVGKSRRIALSMIDISGLKLEKLAYEPDVSCTDCVLAIRYKDEEIQAGDKLRKGEKITLVLGRESSTTTAVPRLYGLTYKEAAEAIVSQSLNVGYVLSCKGCQTAEDSLNAYVANQMPKAGAQINLGSYIDLYLTTEEEVFEAFDLENDSLYNDTLFYKNGYEFDEDNEDY